MSKWALLRSAITGKPDVKTDTDDISIHRFKGFEVIAKRKVIWKGFKLQISMKPAETGGVSELCLCGADEDRNRADDPFKSCCQVCCQRIKLFENFLNSSYLFLSATEIQENLLQVECPSETSHFELLEQLIKQGEGLEKYRLQHLKREKLICGRTEKASVQSSEDTVNSLKAAFYIEAVSLESSSTSCQYYVYDLKSGNLGMNCDAISERSIRKIFHEEILKGNESIKCDFSDKQNSACSGCGSKEEIGEEGNNTEVNHLHINHTAGPKPNSAQVEREQERERGGEGGRGGREGGEEPESEGISSVSVSVSIFTREQAPSARVKGSGLLSHYLHGVDNTGACDQPLNALVVAVTHTFV
jgi:hypothetical protein